MYLVTKRFCRAQIKSSTGFKPKKLQITTNESLDIELQPRSYIVDRIGARAIRRSQFCTDEIWRIFPHSLRCTTATELFCKIYFLCDFLCAQKCSFRAILDYQHEV